MNIIKKILEKVASTLEEENYPLTGAPKTDRWLRKSGEKGDLRFAGSPNQDKEKGWKLDEEEDELEENEEEEEFMAERRKNVSKFVDSLLREYTKYY